MRVTLVIQHIKTNEEHTIIVGNIPDDWSIDKAKEEITKQLLTSQFKTVVYTIKSIRKNG